MPLWTSHFRTQRACLPYGAMLHILCLPYRTWTSLRLLLEHQAHGSGQRQTHHPGSKLLNLRLRVAVLRLLLLLLAEAKGTSVLVLLLLLLLLLPLKLLLLLLSGLALPPPRRRRASCGLGGIVASAGARVGSSAGSGRPGRSVAARAVTATSNDTGNGNRTSGCGRGPAGVR